MKVTHPIPNGSDDTHTLQADLDSGACVRLNDNYKITAPLVVKAPARLEGDPGASILYRGGTTDRPAVTCVGQGAKVSQLTIWCQYHCRGVRFEKCWYDHIAAGLRIYDARQLTLDLEDCYNGNMTDVRLFNSRGPAFRARHSNSVFWELS